jgi:5-methyltetrahydropteroyltriglutamate--homocysteine methyltransferase
LTQDDIFGRPMRTTVIGSHPLSHAALGANAVVLSVEEQIAAGIQLVSDGQTRGDMISVYTGVLKGLEVRAEGAEKKMFITGKVGPGDFSWMIEDLALARKTAGDRARVKADMTGPVTMAFSSILDTKEYTGYRDRRLYMDMAGALRELARMYGEAGADQLQIDEPFFSVGVHMELAREAVEHLAAGFEGETALHVCGDVSKIFDRLLHFSGIQVLSHGFAGTRSNLDLIDRGKLVDAQKILGFGCIDTASERVETAGETVTLIRKGIALAGRENMVIHPDCGMRALPHDVAVAKLKAMCLAARMA